MCKFNSLDQFQKSKDYLIAIDSDGCVFDNMTLKHNQHFYPKLIRVFEMDHDDQKAKLWESINLDYPLRGINRFLGLEKFLETYKPKWDMEDYHQWIGETQSYSNDSLQAFIEKTEDSLCKKVLEWSLAVNKSVKEITDLHLFNGVSLFLEGVREKADIVVVSSANKDAITREWTKAGLIEYVSYLGSQQDGTKEEILGRLVDKGYDTRKILMVGDAISDYKAAKANGVEFYRITYRSEEDAWKTLVQDACDKFFQGTYLYMGDEVMPLAWEQALDLIKVNVDAYYEGFQHVSEDDIYPKEENKLWTMGFYPGQLYLAYQKTGDPYYIKHRKEILESFRNRCDSGHMETHDIGFLFEMTAYYDYLATGDPKSKKLFLDAADKLMKRYHEKGGYIQAWGPLTSQGQTRIIIDCMMNLPLLYLASQETGHKKYAQAAASHAKISMRTLLRDDASTYHTYWMDVESGKPLRGATHQGHRDESIWARGQAWSLYGFLKSYQFTQNQDFLEASKRSADVFLKGLPDNDICYWDFDFSAENPDIYDSSAASIAICGLLGLAKVLTGQEAFHYEYEAKRLLMILANRFQNTQIKEGMGILKEGMYHRDQGARAFTSWGDYYFVEALSTFFRDRNHDEEM